MVTRNCPVMRLATLLALFKQGIGKDRVVFLRVGCVVHIPDPDIPIVIQHNARH